MSGLTTSIHYCAGGSSQGSWARKIDKRHLDQEGKMKTMFIHR